MAQRGELPRTAFGWKLTSVETDVNRYSLVSRHELTFITYLQGLGQNEEQIVIWNNERQLVGPAYRWLVLATPAGMQALRDTGPRPNVIYGLRGTPTAKRCVKN